MPNQAEPNLALTGPAVPSQTRPCPVHFFAPRLTAHAVKTFWRKRLPLDNIQSSKLTPEIDSSRLASSREGRLFSQKIFASVAGLTPSHSATWYCRIVFMPLFIFYLKTFGKRKFAFCFLLVRRLRGAAAAGRLPLIFGALQAGWYGWRCTSDVPAPESTKKAPPRQRWGFVAALSRSKANKTRRLEYTRRAPELSNIV